MQFLEPHDAPYTYLAWSIDLRTTGPFVRKSTTRDGARASLLEIANDLRKHEDVEVVRVLETTFVPPMKGIPQYDLVLLVRAQGDYRPRILERTNDAGLPEPSLAATVNNAGLFGDTDAFDGPFMLNHFAGTTDPNAAVDAWKSVSRWYMDKLDVDNSTLLRFGAGEDWIIVNYARIPAPVPMFLIGQLFRPSFYRNVRAQLSEVGMDAFPIFTRRVSA
ncbi:hypothetical protein [Leucobacter sp. M11]|uniref:hypothetical protein n=1 Tax=Leucobacter sp. M11 TaxID=2993565 RepID=UPI002D80597C|nr:hypothetical protein [Leucobacter sp. M11]MEB4613742.1 hypothetical protein [Leucobacter sp. M11]